MTFAKVWPPSFLYKTYIEYAEHKEDNEGGEGDMKLWSRETA